MTAETAETPDGAEAVDVRGQVALVTGGGRGVGRAIAEDLAGAGAAVAVTARSADQLAEKVRRVEAAGGRAVATPGDVTDRAAVEGAVAMAERALGPIGLLVNNAGTAAALGPFWETDPDVWWRDAEVHVRGAVLCARAVLPGIAPPRWRPGGGQRTEGERHGAPGRDAGAVPATPHPRGRLHSG